jgi:hypothetical protein
MSSRRRSTAYRHRDVLAALIEGVRDESGTEGQTPGHVRHAPNEIESRNGDRFRNTAYSTWRETRCRAISAAPVSEGSSNAAFSPNELWLWAISSTMFNQRSIVFC